MREGEDARPVASENFGAMLVVVVKGIASRAWKLGDGDCIRKPSYSRTIHYYGTPVGVFHQHFLEFCPIAVMRTPMFLMFETLRMSKVTVASVFSSSKQGLRKSC